MVTSAGLSALQRRLVPSLTDVLFVILLFAQLGPRILSADTGWHLATGLRVLAEGPHAFPDPWSFTRGGVPWRPLEWLGEAVLALAWRHAGYAGVGLVCAIAFAGTIAWLYRVALRESGHTVVALGLTLLAAAVVYLHALARPVLLSFPVLLAAWELARVPRPPRLVLVGLPLLTLLWANLHPSAVLGPLLAVYAWLAHSRTRWAGLAVLGSLLALGATPWGSGWLGELVPQGRSLDWLDEWAPPRFDQLRFAAPLVMLLLAIAVRSRARARNRMESLLGLLLVAAVLRSARMAPVAALLWTPVLARDLAEAIASLRGLPGKVVAELRRTFDPFERVLRPGLWPVAASIALLALAPAMRLSPALRAGFPETAFPVRALAVADSLHLGPRVFNDYGWGGTVTWVAGGRYLTFCDGRLGLFQGDVLDDYVRIGRAHPGWAEALARRRVDWLLVRPSALIAQVAPLTGAWSVAHVDSTAVILVPGNSSRLVTASQRR